MPDGRIDPASLEGDALRRWYLRTPEELARERQARLTRDHDDFFRGASAGQQPIAGAGTHYGSLYAPEAEDLGELRRRQTAFEQTRRDISRENSWMAGPVLAPLVAVVGVEAGAAIAARFASQVTRSPGPLMLTRREPYLRVGQNWATKAGQRADKYYKDLAKAKDGWGGESRVPGSDGRMLKPDIRTPPRARDPEVNNYIEVKPNTPSGRAAARRQVAKYRKATGRRVRALFYDPKEFM